jgi:hypothetical protein
MAAYWATEFANIQKELVPQIRLQTMREALAAFEKQKISLASSATARK